MLWMSWKPLFICLFLFGCNYGFLESDTPAYRNSKGEMETEKMDEKFDHEIGGRHLRRFNDECTCDEYVTREEYYNDKNIAMSKVEQNTVKLMKFDSSTGKNRKGINELKANSVKRCESKSMKLYCEPTCCRIDGGDCKSLETGSKFTVYVSFSKAFDKPPTVFVASPAVELSFRNRFEVFLRPKDTYDFYTSDVTASGFNVKYSFSDENLSFKKAYKIISMACA